MIKVLHFVSTPAIWSGVMSVIMNYYRHIDRSKIQFDFLCFIPCKSAQESYEGEIEELGGRFFLIPKPGSSIVSLRQLKTFLAIHGSEYAWLHNHEVYLSFLLEPLAKRSGFDGFIVHSHATKYSDNPLSALRNRLLCLPIRFMKSRKGFHVELFACSKAAGEFLYGKRRLESGGVYIMHNAIDCEKFRFDPEKRAAIRKELDLEGKFVIGHVGRFERQKNHEFLIKVFAECRKQRGNCVLMLVGDGALKPRIESQVRKLGLEDSVMFLGQRDDAARLYQGMDVFVLPSLYEGLPVSCLEAQASGLPCVMAQAITPEVCISPISSRRNIWDNPKDWAPHVCVVPLIKREKISISVFQRAKYAGYTLEKEAANLNRYYLR